MSEAKIYKVPSKVKISMGILMLVVTFLILVVFVLIGARVPIIVPVIFGVFFFLASITTVTLTSTEVIVKPILGRTKRFSYLEGEFEKRSLSGIAAFIATGKGSATMIFFRKEGAKRLALAVNGYFNNADVEEMFKEIEQRRVAMKSA